MLAGILIMSLLSSCGIYAPSDARKVSPNSKERVKKNLEEGKGFSFGKSLDSGGTSYQFASSNPMWRATLETLDFLPMSTVDYSGGIIITDWYTNNQQTNKSVKITIRFLSNEIASNSLKIVVHEKSCINSDNCATKILSNSRIKDELNAVILRKAALFEKEIKSKKK